MHGNEATNLHLGKLADKLTILTDKRGVKATLSLLKDALSFVLLQEDSLCSWTSKDNKLRLLVTQHHVHTHIQLSIAIRGEKDEHASTCQFARLMLKLC